MPFPAVLADELAASMVGKNDKNEESLVFADQRSRLLRNSPGGRGHRSSGRNPSSASFGIHAGR